MLLNIKVFLRFAFISLAVGVGLGAFGAHSLKGMLEVNQRTDTWNTATLYLYIHCLGIICVIGASKVIAFNPTAIYWALKLFAFGICVFSGSLYVLCITNYSKLGMITPLGGVAFVFGWIILLFGIEKTKMK